MKNALLGFAVAALLVASFATLGYFVGRPTKQTRDDIFACRAKGGVPVVAVDRKLECLKKEAV